MSPVMRCHFGIGVDISWNVNQMALYSLGVVSCGGGGHLGSGRCPEFPVSYLELTEWRFAFGVFCFVPPQTF